MAERYDARLSTLESELGARPPWTNEHLGLVVDRFKDRLPADSDLLGIPYASTEPLEELARGRAGSTVAAPRCALKRRLDDKQATRELFGSLHLPVIPVRSVSPGHTFGQIASEIGVPFVLQRTIGSSGHSSYSVTTEDEWDRAISTDEKGPWIASQFLSGVILNVHCFLGASGSELFPPSLQFAGIECLTDEPFAYSGNDFGEVEEIDKDVLVSANHIVKAVAEKIRSWGYRGVLGVDLILNERGVWPLEVNPRMQGSTWILAAAQERAGQIPLCWRQVLDFTQGPSTDFAPGELLATAGHLIFRWMGPSSGVRPSLRPGIYSFTQGRLAFKRTGVDLGECGSGELLIVGIPDRCEIEHGASALRVAGWRRFGSNGNRLSPDLKDLVSALRREIESWAIPPRPTMGIL